MELSEIADGVWVDTDPVRIVGMHLAVTMTVLRLPGGVLALHSPISLSDERRAAIERLGTVGHLIAPNLFHHRWIGDWANAYPAARLHVPPGLPKKRPDLPVARSHTDETEAAFASTIDAELVDGFRLREVVMFYRPGRTLVLADLVHNIGRPRSAWTRLYSRSMGFYDKVALSRMIRWTAFSDPRAARRSIDRVLEWKFDRLVVGHGSPVTTAAKDSLATAFEWLRRLPRP